MQHIPAPIASLNRSASAEKRQLTSGVTLSSSHLCQILVYQVNLLSYNQTQLAGTQWTTYLTVNECQHALCLQSKIGYPLLRASGQTDVFGVNLPVVDPPLEVPPPRVHRTLCPTNTSGRTAFFWDLIDEVLN